MASVENQLLLIAYITLAAVIAMIYGMRRIFLLENKIVRLERLLIGRIKPKGKKVAKKKAKKKKRR